MPVRPPDDYFKDPDKKDEARRKSNRSMEIQLTIMGISLAALAAFIIVLAFSAIFK